ncbi:MAG: hypothetical protein Q9161_006087 [Pseudevernia consocians]
MALPFFTTFLHTKMNVNAITALRSFPNSDNTAQKQSLFAEASTPVPAKIPTVDQPEATNTAAPIPLNQEGPNLEPQPNNPINQESSQSQQTKVEPSSNNKEGNDPQQYSVSHQDSSLEQGGGSSGDSGQEAGSKPNSDSSQVDSNQGSNPESVPQGDPKQTDDVNPFDGFAEGQVQTINNQVVQPLSYGISIAGTTLAPGAPTITVSGTPIYFGLSILVVGTSTVPLAPGSPTQMITTIAGQAITAAPSAVIIVGNTLHPGGPGTTIDGTILSLNSAGQLIVGSKTIALPNGSTGSGAPSKVADPITITVDGQVITAGPAALVMAGTTLTPGAPGFTIAGTLVSLNTDAQLVIGSKTIPLESENGVFSGQTASLGGLILGGFGNGGPFGPFGTISPSPANGNLPTGGGNGTNTSVQAFQGNAAGLQDPFSWNSMAVAAIAMCTLMYLC